MCPIIAPGSRSHSKKVRNLNPETRHQIRARHPKPELHKPAVLKLQVVNCSAERQFSLPPGPKFGWQHSCLGFQGATQSMGCLFLVLSGPLIIGIRHLTEFSYFVLRRLYCKLYFVMSSIAGCPIPQAKWVQGLRFRLLGRRSKVHVSPKYAL